MQPISSYVHPIQEALQIKVLIGLFSRLHVLVTCDIMVEVTSKVSEIVSRLIYCSYGIEVNPENLQ